MLARTVVLPQFLSVIQDPVVVQHHVHHLVLSSAHLLSTLTHCLLVGVDQDLATKGHQDLKDRLALCLSSEATHRAKVLLQTATAVHLLPRAMGLVLRRGSRIHNRCGVECRLALVDVLLRKTCNRLLNRRVGSEPSSHLVPAWIISGWNFCCHHGIPFVCSVSRLYSHLSTRFQADTR